MRKKKQSFRYFGVYGGFVIKAPSGEWENLIMLKVSTDVYRFKHRDIMVAIDRLTDITHWNIDECTFKVWQKSLKKKHAGFIWSDRKREFIPV